MVDTATVIRSLACRDVIRERRALSPAREVLFILLDGKRYVLPETDARSFDPMIKACRLRAICSRCIAFSSTTNVTLWADYSTDGSVTAMSRWRNNVVSAVKFLN